jgi:ring-1,2-phenylacetyl-CoA epoxidase subunit PaaB
MTDQWPRYEVFKQDRPGGPHRNVGSVHAPDAELALMNARDVFARRPACHSLWVAPAEAILRWTAEELAGAEERGRCGPDRSRGAGGTTLAGEGESKQYSVFSKQSQKQAMTYVDYVGEVVARSAEEALRKAVAAYPESPGIVWWVCPAGAIVSSEPDDAPGFEAAAGKLFRLPNQYRTVFTMQKIKRGEEEEG